MVVRSVSGKLPSSSTSIACCRIKSIACRVLQRLCTHCVHKQGIGEISAGNTWQERGESDELERRGEIRMSKRSECASGYVYVVCVEQFQAQFPPIHPIARRIGLKECGFPRECCWEEGTER